MSFSRIKAVLSLSLLWLLLCLRECVFASNIQRRGQHMEMVKDARDLDLLKSWKNGSIILFAKNTEAATELFEANLIRAFNQISKYGIKMKKVNCSKFAKSISECQMVTEQLVFVYKSGEEKFLEKNLLNGTAKTTNEFLFFFASANYDKLLYCGNMDQAKEILELNKKLFNTIVGSFQQLDSEYLRHFLETAIEIGHNFAFLLVDNKSFQREKFGKRGYFVTFYYTFYIHNGDYIEEEDITEHARATKDLKYIIETMGMTEDMHNHAQKILDAKKNQDDRVKKLQEEAAAELKKNQSKTVSLKGKEAAMVNLKRSSRLDDLPDRQFDDRSEIDSEIAFDAFSLHNRETRLIYQESDILLNETELKMAILKSNTIKDHLSVVLFYVPWDPTFQMFIQSYEELALELKDDNHVDIVHFNCYAWPTPCKQFQIYSYPIILVYRNELQPFRYTDFLHKETIKSHIELWKEPFLPTFNDIRNLEQLAKQMSMMFIIGVFKKQENRSQFQMSFEKASLQHYGKIRIATLIVKQDTISFRQQVISVPSLISINAIEVKNRVTINNELDEETLQHWFDEQRQLEVQQLNALNFPRMMHLKKPFFISFRSKEKDRSSLIKFARKNREVITVWMDIDDPTTQSIQRVYKLKDAEAIVLVDTATGKVFEFNQDKKTIENISKWLKMCLRNGEMTPTYTMLTRSWPPRKGYDFLKLIRESDDLNEVENKAFTDTADNTDSEETDDNAEEHENQYRHYDEL